MPFIIRYHVAKLGTHQPGQAMRNSPEAGSTENCTQPTAPETKAPLGVSKWLLMQLRGLKLSGLHVKQQSEAVPLKYCETKYFPLMITAHNGIS